MKKVTDILTQNWRTLVRAETLCVFFLAAMALNLASNAARKSLTNDETVHIPPAHRYLVAGDFTMNPEHPPLAKLWSAVPLSFVRLRYYRVFERKEWDFAEFTGIYSAQFWQLNRNNSWQIIFWARLPMVVLTISLGILIFVYAKTRFSLRAAVFAVAMFSVEPTMLAHGWMVHTDVPAAFAYLLFFFTLQKYWTRPTLWRTISFGLVTGVAVVTKFSMAVIVPVFLAVLVYVEVKAGQVEPSKLKRIARVCLATMAIIVVVNAAYYFQHASLSQQDAKWIMTYSSSPLTGERVLGCINATSKIIPTQYLFGFYTVFIHNQLGHPSSLLGRHSQSGWWFYFPVVFALKTSLPFLLLSIASIGWALWLTLTKHQQNVFALLLAIAIYLGMAMLSHINIGIRHIAPIFPFLCLLAAAFVDRLLNTRYIRAAWIVTILLMAWMVVDAVLGYRNYISFSNSLTFGRPAWQLLSDSNVEYGEEIGELAKYLRSQGETRMTAAMSAGMTPYLNGIEVVGYAPRDLQSSPTRYVALGASSLNGSTVRNDLKDETGSPLSEDQRVNYFATYRTLTPEKVFGNSIYLYRKRE